MSSLIEAECHVTSNITYSVSNHQYFLHICLLLGEVHIVDAMDDETIH